MLDKSIDSQIDVKKQRMIDKSINNRIDVKKRLNTYGFIDLGFMQPMILKYGNSFIFWKMITEKDGIRISGRII